MTGDITTRASTGQDCTQRPLKLEFSLNQPHYEGAQIILARANFGCGFRREHAPWALHGWGIRVIDCSKLC